MLNISYIHSDFFKYYSNLNNQFNLKDINKSLNLAFEEIKNISRDTIIFPTYNYNFSKKKSFDYYKDESQVGSLSEWFRKKYRNNRSCLPIFSDCSNKGLLKKIKTKFPLGKGSVFELLYKNNSNIIFFGSDFAPSFIMYIEHMISGGPRYRYLKKFNGILKKKGKSKVSVSFYCRPYNFNYKYDLKNLEYKLIKESILKKIYLDKKFYYLDLCVKDFYQYSMMKLNKDSFFFLDQHSKERIKKKLGKSYNFKMRDFE